MTERIRFLLDEAVAGLDPETPDPVATVVRRGRRQRGRQAAAWIAAAVVLVAGGTTAAVWRPEAAPPVGTAASTPPTPYASGGVVIAGAVRLPVPAGWKVVTAGSSRPCGELKNTILIVTAKGRGCERETAPIELGAPQRTDPPGIVVDRPVSTAPVPVTLPGGEPGWLGEPFGSESNLPGRDARYGYYNTLYLPWSRVSMTLRMDGERQRAIVATMSSRPGAAGVLALPGTATMAEVTHGDSIRRIEDPAVITGLRELLARQRDVVADADACAAADQQTLQVVLTSQSVDERQPALTPEDRAKINADPPPLTLQGTAVLVTLGGTCQEAVSQDGGRVRVDDATAATLKGYLR
jgi:hypothetical protein